MGCFKRFEGFPFRFSSSIFKILDGCEGLCFLRDKNINEFSVTELYVANWKLFGFGFLVFFFVSTEKKCALICRGTFSDMSQSGVAFSAILNVCLSALLDWGHIVQHLAGLSPRCWAELKSLQQLFRSKGIPTQGEFSAERLNSFMETVLQLSI